MTLTEIEDSLPWGLHDAYLESLDGDALQGRVHLVLRVMMSEAQDLDQRARIEILGLTYLYLEPPEAEAPDLEAAPSEGLWIDAGAVSPTAVPAPLPPPPPGCFVHRIFVHRWNRSLFLCARSARLEWLEPAPLPARARTRALLPGTNISK